MLVCRQIKHMINHMPNLNFEPLEIIKKIGEELNFSAADVEKLSKSYQDLSLAYFADKITNIFAERQEILTEIDQLVGRKIDYNEFTQKLSQMQFGNLDKDDLKSKWQDAAEIAFKDVVSDLKSAYSNQAEALDKLITI